MNLYLIKPIKKGSKLNPFEGTPWDPWWNKCFGAVMRAGSEAEARQIMSDSEYVGDAESKLLKQAWLDESQSKVTCLAEGVSGEKEIILSDFRQA